MNSRPHVLSLVQAVRTFSAPSPGPYTDHMLAKLLARHEEMIAQLRHERLNVAGDIDFLTGMIDQHERAAATRRLRLKSYELETA